MLTRQTKRYGHVAAIEDYEYLFLQVQNVNRHAYFSLTTMAPLTTTPPPTTMNATIATTTTTTT